MEPPRDDETIADNIRAVISHAPPWPKEEFEELFFYKRLFKKCPTQYTVARPFLEWFETHMKVTIPDAEVQDIPAFLAELKTKSYTTISDILLLSYCNERANLNELKDTDADILKGYITDHQITLMKPNPAFFPETKQMVQGIRVPPAPQAVQEQQNQQPQPKYAIDQGVEARFKGKSRWYGGHITAYDPQTKLYTILYHDGDTETDVKEEFIREPQPLNETIAARVRVDGPPTSRALRIPPSDTQTPHDEELAIHRHQFMQHTLADISNFRKLSDALDATYWDPDTTNSTALDIIAVYLKGQKILYIEAKSHCESHLTMLMLPSMFVSVLSSVLSLALKDFGWGPTLISSLTAVNTFLLGIISWLKLDARAEAHKTSSYQFDKLQSMCEFHSGKVLFFRDTSAKTLVDDIEKKVQEIKDTNQFVIPEAVRMRFPEAYNTNIFSLVKTIENKENTVKTRMNTIVDEIIRLQHIQNPTPEQQTRATALEAEKAKCMIDYIALREEYMKLDTKFNTEILADIASKKRRLNCCSWVSN